MERIKIDPTNIDFSLVRKVSRTIIKGGIVALPTETVYGLAGRADDPAVVDKLYSLKNRPKTKPFTYIVDSAKRAREIYFATLIPFACRLIENFWPGPLTVIYYSKNDKKIGVRVPSHVILREILKEVETDVYLPSANISGEKEPVTADEVEAVLGGKINLLVDGGEAIYSQPSTVIDLTQQPFKILREGVISENEIIEVFIKKRILFVCTGNTCRSPMAEYLLKKYLAEQRPYMQDRYEILSCGISPFPGNPPTAEIVRILQEKEGIFVADSYSRKIDSELLLSSDLIFVMSDDQKAHLLKFEPTIDGRVFTLKQFLPREIAEDIPDPIGRGSQIYDQAYQLIKKAVLELREWV